MQVSIVSATRRPMTLVSKAAGKCYGKTNYSEKRVASCIKSGHLSVIEHVSATFEIKGISRSCLAQLTRHRLASFSVQSQRYCKIKGGDWYVVPPKFAESKELLAFYERHMDEARDAYQAAIDAGVRMEDARFLIPEAAKTELVVTMNARELLAFLKLRMDSRAQWEIRLMAGEMLKAASEIDGEWSQMISMLTAVM